MSFSGIIQGVLGAIGLADWFKDLLNNYQQRQQGKAELRAEIDKEALGDAKKQAETFAAPDRDKLAIVERMRQRAKDGMSAPD